MCVCVCVCVCARACVRVCVCLCEDEATRQAWEVAWEVAMTGRVKIVNELFDRAYNCTKNHSGHRLFGKHSSQSETSSGLIVLTTNG